MKRLLEIGDYICIDLVRLGVTKLKCTTIEQIQMFYDECEEKGFYIEKAREKTPNG